MDWQAILQSTLGAGLGTVLVQVIAPWWRDRRARRSQAAYLALRLAVSFEEFGAACSERNSDNANAPHLPDQECPEWNAQLPEKPVVPDDLAGWLALCALDSTLADRALTFQSRIASATSAIAHCIEYYEEDLDVIMPIQISKCGLEANRLACDLRSRFALAASEIAQDWPAYLEAALEAAQDRQRVRRERSLMTLDVGDAARRDETAAPDDH